MKWYIPQLDRYLGGVGITILGASALLAAVTCLTFVAILVVVYTPLGAREAARTTVFWTLGALAFVLISWIVGEIIAGVVGRK